MTDGRVFEKFAVRFFPNDRTVTLGELLGDIREGRLDLANLYVVNSLHDLLEDLYAHGSGGSAFQALQLSAKTTIPQECTQGTPLAEFFAAVWQKTLAPENVMAVLELLKNKAEAPTVQKAVDMMNAARERVESCSR